MVETAGFEPALAGFRRRGEYPGFSTSRVNVNVKVVGSRGFEPRPAQSECAASANCATSRDGDHGRIRTANLQALDLPPLPRLGYMVIGPSGWTRTTTSRVKSPACCVDTTKGMELIPSIELGRRPYHGRMLPLHQISTGASDRTQTGTSRLGRPVCALTPHSHLVRPTGLEPVPPRWRRGMLPPTPRPNRRRLFADVPTSFSCQRPCSFRAGGQQGIRTESALAEDDGVTARQTIRSYCPLRCWRQRQDFDATMLFVT
jgi:hypothetical protein